MTKGISSQRQVGVGDGNGNDSGGYAVATEVGYEELVQSSELFWEKLKAFHRSLGTKFICSFMQWNGRGHGLDMGF